MYAQRQHLIFPTHISRLRPAHQSYTAHEKYMYVSVVPKPIPIPPYIKVTHTRERYMGNSNLLGNHVLEIYTRLGAFFNPLSEIGNYYRLRRSPFGLARYKKRRYLTCVLFMYRTHWLIFCYRVYAFSYTQSRPLRTSDPILSPRNMTFTI